MHSTIQISSPMSSKKAFLAYESGTILLSNLPQGLARTNSLPFLTWDPRVGRYRAPAYLYSACVKRLEELGYEIEDDVARWNGKKPLQVEPTSLRPYQSQALLAWEQMGRRGILLLPTGSGKTHIALAALERCRLPTLVLVPTRVLMAQWMERLLSVTQEPIGQMGDGVQEIRPITVSTFESAYRYLDRHGDLFGMLVVDEAHHFGSGMRAEALEMTPAPFRLGLTATLDRSPESVRLLERLLGPPVYHLTINELAGTFLADLDTVVVPIRFDPSEEAEYQRHKGVFLSAFRRFKAFRPRGTWPEFVEWARTGQDGLRALAAWHRCQAIMSYPKDKRRVLSGLLTSHRDDRVLVFTRDNEAAYEISRTHLIPALTCDIKRKERKYVLEAFRQGRVRALVSARVLNEGLDIPEASVGVIVGSSGSCREYVQRVGRLLRPGPDKKAKVYELVVESTGEARNTRKNAMALADRMPCPGFEPLE